MQSSPPHHYQPNIPTNRPIVPNPLRGHTCGGWMIGVDGMQPFPLLGMPPYLPPYPYPALLHPC
jgi:hypothetical protein